MDFWAVAKTCLGLPADASDTNVPKAFVEELRSHCQLYPHDINFLVTLEPGSGFGRVACGELGCEDVVVPLKSGLATPDGGLEDGIGSLSPYRLHVARHPTHVRNRNIRLAKTKASPVKMENSLLDTLDLGSSSTAHFRQATSGRLGSQAGRRVSSLIRVKPEPMEFPLQLDCDVSRATNAIDSIKTLSIPHENGRVNGQSLKGQHTALASSSNISVQNSDQPPSTLAASKKPLGPVNPNATLQTPAGQASPSGPSSIEDIRFKITDVQTRISSQQAKYNKLASKKRPSKADLTRMARYSKQLVALRQRKDKYNALIPTMSPAKRPVSKSSSFSLQAPQTKTKAGLDTKMEGPLHSGAPPLPSFPPYTQPQVQSCPLPPSSKQPAVLLPLIPRHGSQGWDEDEDDMDLGIDHGYMLPDVMQKIGPIVPRIPSVRNAGNFDDDGDWFGRGKDLFVGPRAKADDIDKFLMEAGNAEAFDGNATVEQALQKLGLQSQYDLLPGMEVALMTHQTIGVAWMMEKEKSKFKGGALGDDMGLGKTVQMIATLVQNQSDDPMCKTNLIITPAALLDQWRMEIEMKTNCDLSVLIYHGPTKVRKKQELLKYDVVITTYATMAFEWPDLEKEQKMKMKAKKQKKNNFIASDSEDDLDDRYNRAKKRRREVGLLFQVEFHRIILDEAQSIRNRRTRMSRAVTDLQATHRWCLTGTPIVNGLADVYGYLRFLRIRPWYDFAEFQEHIGILEKKDPTLAASRLQAIIATFVLRRMKDSMLDGKRLIELPPKKIDLVKLEFSPEEREVYNLVERGAQASFNRFLRAGTVLKNYSQVLVLLLRLRQICSHPSLIQEGCEAFISPEEVDDDFQPELATELTRARRLVSSEFVTKMKEKFKWSTLEQMRAEKESPDAVAEEEECPICFDNLTDAVLTPCAHIFCRGCLTDILNTPLVAGGEDTKYASNERPCPTCRAAISAQKMFSRSAFMPSDKDLFPEKYKSEDDEIKDAVPRSRPGKAIKKRKRAKRARRSVADCDEIVSEVSEDADEDDGLSDFIVEDDEDEEEKDARRALKKCLGKRRAQVVLDSDEEMDITPEEEDEVLCGRKAPVPPEQIKLLPRFLPSTKMKYMMDQLRDMLEERPEEKAIVVSQWTSCLSLVSDYLTEAGILHVKYQGDMSRAKRENAVRVFMSRDNAQVMLMSLKCGGVGLNLTRANNLISLDLGWSQAVESQSFDRIHRLGQNRPVSVQRLVIADTVEDRILALQERKQLLADGSLGEGTAKKIGRLSIRELANLFGLDHRGRVLGK